MRIFKFLLGVLVSALVVGSFFGLPFAYFATWFQTGPAAVALLSREPLAWTPFVFLLVLTVLFGRFFCEALCPLGLVQTLVNWVFHPRSHVRRVCTRLPATRTQRLVRAGVLAVFVGLLACGHLGLAALVEPYSLLGRALLLSTPALVVAGVVLVLAAVGRGRLWCNWVCPVGTLVSLGAKVAPFGNRVGRGCQNCRACMACADAPASPRAKENENAGITRRETLKGVATAAIAEKLTDGGLAEVSLPGQPDRGGSVLPPGAGSRAAFARKCLACGLCTTVCPEGILRPSTRLATLGQPELDFRRGYCIPGCVKCGTVCPTDAIVRLQAETKANCHVGHAIWKKDLCVRTTTGDVCTACVRKCPVRAITLVAGFPVVDRGTCIGCGACEHVCPARPMPAIYVKGFEVQRMVNRMSETDLLEEMKTRLATDSSVVVAKDGVIVDREEGRGIGPLLKMLDNGNLKDALVVDKVIGRAAAGICVLGGARRVYATLMSEDAADYLKSHGVACAADKTVAKILNRDRSDRCPMEKSVDGKTDPADMVAAIRATLSRLQAKKGTTP